VLRNNRRGQSGLWSYGISGDAPLVLLRISDLEKIEIVRQLIQAHSYWRMKGLTVELVILNEDVSVYRQSLHDQITSLISSGIEAQMLDKPGGIFVRRLDQIPNDDRVLLQSCGADCPGRREGNFDGATGTSKCFGAFDADPEAHPFRVADLPTPLTSTRADFSERLWRLYPRRPRICHHPSTRPDDAGTVGQCAGQSLFRNGYFRERRGLHLG
jgi:hypothetical protein